MSTATSTQELRLFLDQCVNSTTPVIYTDKNGKTHKVYLTRVNESKFKNSKGRDEPVLSLMMIEAEAETQEGGASGAREQEIFLLQCADSTVPLDYIDSQNRRHRVFMTRMEKKNRRTNKAPAASEWAYALTMVDAWSGVWIYQIQEIAISVMKTVTLQPHTATKWDAFTWDLAQWE